MAQYKHSRLGSLKFPGSDSRNRTFGGTMLAFIFALLLVLVIAGIISIGITYTTDSIPVYNEDRGTLILSDTLALDGPYSSHATGGWTFVPNITPETAKASLAHAMNTTHDRSPYFWPSSVLTNHRPYAETVGIRDTWKGWFDYNNTAQWFETDRAPEYQHFTVDNKDCYSAAYVGHFECSKEINALSLTFHKYNGTAWIFCNGEFIQKIGDKTPVFNLKAFADYCTLIPENGKLDLVIVIACTPQVSNPGLLSEPIIETRVANDVRTVITAGHFAIVTMLFLVALGVGALVKVSRRKKNG